MRVKYFEDTDTLYITLADRPPVETRELNSNVMLELDEQGQVVALTVEQAKLEAGKLDFSFESVAA